jgi:hypothetical protein
VAARDTDHISGESGFCRWNLSWLRTVIAVKGTAMTKISAPSSSTSCGTRASAELISTNSRTARVSAARAGSMVVLLSMLSRLIDTATNSSPTSAAAAPVTAVKNAAHVAGSFPCIEGPLHERDSPDNLKLSRSDPVGGPPGGGRSCHHHRLRRSR